MTSATIFIGKRHDALADALKSRYQQRFPAHEVTVKLVDGLIKTPVLNFQSSDNLTTVNPHTGDLIPFESGKEQREFLHGAFEDIRSEIYGIRR